MRQFGGSGCRGTPAPRRRQCRRGTMAKQAHALANAERRHLTIVFCDWVEIDGTRASGWTRGLRSGHCRVSRRLCAGDRALSRLRRSVPGRRCSRLFRISLGARRRYGSSCSRRTRRSSRGPRGRTRSGRRRGACGLSARVGIDTGVVVVSQTVAGAGRQSLAFGDTVNIAARLEKLAKPGTVVVSSATTCSPRVLLVHGDRGSASEGCRGADHRLWRRR